MLQFMLSSDDQVVPSHILIPTKRPLNGFFAALVPQKGAHTPDACLYWQEMQQRMY